LGYVVKIISATERLAEARGAKILIVGPNAVGKTSLLRTLDDEQRERTLFIDIEAGDLAILDLPIATIQIKQWSEARDLACKLGGPNPSFSPTMCYSLDIIIVSSEPCRISIGSTRSSWTPSQR
jgi:hypothetical protein